MRALENLFGCLSPGDQQSFLARSSASSSPAPEATSTEHLTTMQAESVAVEDTPSPAQSRTSKVTAVKRRQLLNERQTKKPLNAFMAFRCKIFPIELRHATQLTRASAYYSPVLENLTQKAKSGMIQKMWAEETSKATLHYLRPSVFRDSRQRRQCWPGQGLSQEIPASHRRSPSDRPS